LIGEDTHDREGEHGRTQTAAGVQARLTSAAVPLHPPDHCSPLNTGRDGDVPTSILILQEPEALR